MPLLHGLGRWWRRPHTRTPRPVPAARPRGQQQPRRWVWTTSPVAGKQPRHSRQPPHKQDEKQTDTRAYVRTREAAAAGSLSIPGGKEACEESADCVWAVFCAPVGLSTVQRRSAAFCDCALPCLALLVLRCGWSPAIPIFEGRGGWRQLRRVRCVACVTGELHTFPRCLPCPARSEGKSASLCWGCPLRRSWLVGRPAAVVVCSWLCVATTAPYQPPPWLAAPVVACTACRRAYPAPPRGTPPTTYAVAAATKSRRSDRTGWGRRAGCLVDKQEQGILGLPKQQSKTAVGLPSIRTSLPSHAPPVKGRARTGG